jgi:hypothetical protein
MKLRNHVARSPLLRKGGVHLKSKSNQRAHVKYDIKKAITEWKTNRY